MKLTLTTHEPPRFTVANDRLWTVHLEPIPGERGRFRAFSETNFHCPNCRTMFKRSVKRQGVVGCECEKCGADAERVEYLVNVLEPGGRPHCRCESNTMNQGRVECKHASAALYLFGKLEAAAAAERQDGP